MKGFRLRDLAAHVTYDMGEAALATFESFIEKSTRPTEKIRCNRRCTGDGLVP